MLKIIDIKIRKIRSIRKMRSRIRIRRIIRRISRRIIQTKLQGTENTITEETE